MIRQGDLLFIPVDEVHKDNKNEKGVIREGEATGHHHRLADLGAAEVYRPSWWGGDAYVLAHREATIVHEEHGPVTLPPGAYRVHVAREFDYVGSYARNVMD